MSDLQKSFQWFQIKYKNWKMFEAIGKEIMGSFSNDGSNDKENVTWK